MILSCFNCFNHRFPKKINPPIHWLDLDIRRALEFFFFAARKWLRTRHGVSMVSIPTSDIAHIAKKSPRPTWALLPSRISELRALATTSPRVYLQSVTGMKWDELGRFWMTKKCRRLTLLVSQKWELFGDSVVFWVFEWNSDFAIRWFFTSHSATILKRIFWGRRLMRTDVPLASLVSLPACWIGQSQILKVLVIAFLSVAQTSHITSHILHILRHVHNVLM